VTVAAIVVAAGSGERFGGRKQFATLAGRPAAAWAVEAARAVADVVVLVVPADAADASLGADLVAVGGATRSASVRAGLAAIDHDTTIVVVHDAARPLASPSLFRSVVGALDDAAVAGAVPGMPLSDTVKSVDAQGLVAATLDRSALVTVQTPQAFVAGALRAAHRGDPEATDDAALVEAGGGRVVVVPGEPSNLKLTTPADLDAAASTLSHAPRIGQGVDAHAFSADSARPLVLGGVVIPGAVGLDGHSDADVATHALCDAILGAAGLGDLGRHFPDDDPTTSGVSSLDLLERCCALVASAGFSVANGDVTVVAEQPRLAGHLEAMAATLSGTAGASVSVKATTTDGLGATGRGEGIAATAVVLLVPVART
jgi:2-C-methyl-D-erythritol 4-phosphate cytidylyltransferase/2-C-methyl-D-erythritol 2,4-cyclodiphosphate synthase